MSHLIMSDEKQSQFTTEQWEELLREEKERYSKLEEGHDLFVDVVQTTLEYVYKELRKMKHPSFKGMDVMVYFNEDDVKTVFWELPESASDTIMETLAMDARSKWLDDEIRDEIREAYESVTIHGTREATS